MPFTVLVKQKANEVPEWEREFIYHLVGDYISASGLEGQGSYRKLLKRYRKSGDDLLGRLAEEVSASAPSKTEVRPAFEEILSQALANSDGWREAETDEQRTYSKNIEVIVTKRVGYAEHWRELGFFKLGPNPSDYRVSVTGEESAGWVSFYDDVGRVLGHLAMTDLEADSGPRVRHLENGLIVTAVKDGAKWILELEFHLSIQLKQKWFVERRDNPWAASRATCFECSESAAHGRESVVGLVMDTWQTEKVTIHREEDVEVHTHHQGKVDHEAEILGIEQGFFCQGCQDRIGQREERALQIGKKWLAVAGASIGLGFVLKLFTDVRDPELFWLIGVVLGLMLLAAAAMRDERDALQYLLRKRQAKYRSHVFRGKLDIGTQGASRN